MSKEDEEERREIKAQRAREKPQKDLERAATWLRDLRDGDLKDAEWSDINEFIDEYLPFTFICEEK